MDHNICPPSPDISDDAHRAAYYRWCLEYIVNDKLLAADMYLKGGLGSISAKDCQVRYEAIVTGLMKRLFNGTDEYGDFWDALWPGGFDAFVSYQKRQFSLHHCGDCTAVAASCGRCAVEALYGLPSSVTWSRHEGFDLLSAYNTKAAKDEEK